MAFGNALFARANFAVYVGYDTEWSGEKGAFVAVNVTGGIQVERYRDKMVMLKHGHTGCEVHPAPVSIDQSSAELNLCPISGNGRRIINGLHRPQKPMWLSWP